MSTYRARKGCYGAAFAFLALCWASGALGAGELRHKDIGAQITQAEWEGVDTHYVLSGATGDVLYVASDGTIKRLAIGTEGYALVVSSGGLPEWSDNVQFGATNTTFTGTINATSITITGLLGVGITTPTEIGHFYKNSNDDTTVLIQNDGASTLSQATVTVQADGATGVTGAFAAISDSFSVADKPNWAGHCVVYTSTYTQGLTLAALSSTGTIRFMTGGANFTTAEQARIDENGRLGVGTTSPANGLDVEGTDGTAGAFRLARNENQVYGPSMYLTLDRAGNAGQDADELGYLVWRTRNSSATVTNFAQIYATAADVTTGTEDGQLYFYAQTAGTMGQVATMNGSAMTMGSNVGLSLSGYLGFTWYDIGNSGVAFAPDYTNGMNQEVDLSTNTTMGLPTNSVQGAPLHLTVVQGNPTTCTLSFNASYVFPGGTTPTVTATAGAIDTYEIRRIANRYMLRKLGADWQ